jgi:hypothetical protein
MAQMLEPTGTRDADVEVIAACLAEGKPVPPDVAARIRQRADAARQQLVATLGVQEIGVAIIREIRGELPHE